MYWQDAYTQYLMKLGSKIKKQQKEIANMTHLIESLQHEVDQLKKNNQPRIDKIEYKFDQLKIETLEGTLNIGLTPGGGGEAIKDLSVNQNSDIPHILEKYPELYPRIKEQISHYINGDCIKLIQAYEQKYHIQLEDQHYQFIIEDIHKQIEERIYFYLHDIPVNDVRSYDNIEQDTIAKVKQDINQAIELFVENMPRGGNG